MARVKEICSLQLVRNYRGHNIQLENSRQYTSLEAVLKTESYQLKEFALYLSPGKDVITLLSQEQLVELFLFLKDALETLGALSEMEKQKIVPTLGESASGELG